MPTLQYYSYFRVNGVTGQKKPLERGTLEVPVKTISVDGDKATLTKSLADSTTWDAWTTGSEEPLTDFDFLWMEATQAVFLELTCDQGADNGTVVFAIEVPANTPFMLTADDAKANFTADFATGTDDVIDQIRIRNESGSTADVELILIS